MAFGAYLLINVTTGSERSVVKDLSKIDGVKHAHVVTGLHDVIAYVEAPSYEGLQKRIVDGIRGVPHITKTVTCTAFDEI